MNNKRSWVGIILLVLAAISLLLEHVVLPIVLKEQIPYTKGQIITVSIMIGAGLLLLDPDHAMEVAKMAKDKLPFGKKSE